jgi:hypothetical protein
VRPIAIGMLAANNHLMSDQLDHFIMVGERRSAKIRSTTTRPTLADLIEESTFSKDCGVFAAAASKA